MNLKMQIDKKVAAAIVVGFIIIWLAGWRACTCSRQPKAQIRPPEQIKVMLICAACGASGEYTVAEYDAMEGDPDGNKKCPRCGKFSVTVNTRGVGARP